MQGVNHRLEIQPDISGSTLLHLSDASEDLEDEARPPDIVVEDDDYLRRMKSLQAEMDNIKAKVGWGSGLGSGLGSGWGSTRGRACTNSFSSPHLKVELEKSMKELEEKDAVLKTTHNSLKKKEAELSNYKECLLDTELENLKLRVSLSRHTSPERVSPLDRTGDAR